MNRIKAFTLVEVLIIVSILGILAALVMPEFGNATTKAKEAAAKETLQMLRTQIERYALQHNDVPPGYINGVIGPRGTFLIQLAYCTNANGEYVASRAPTDAYPYGPYISDFPKNPFNNLVTAIELTDAQELPASATGENGWIYKASDKEVRLDWRGTDSEGTLYYSY